MTVSLPRLTKPDERISRIRLSGSLPRVAFGGPLSPARGVRCRRDWIDAFRVLSRNSAVADDQPERLFEQVVPVTLKLSHPVGAFGFL